MAQKGRLIVIVAPSGTGKSTLIKRVLEDIPVLEWSVSCTTRPIREGEEHGVNYYFIDKEEFQTRIREDDFIEWAMVHSNYYGTSRKFTEKGLKEGRYLLFDVDVQGADSIKHMYPDDSAIIFIEPPSIKELEKRLKGRGTDDKKVIEERLENAKSELLKKNDYDHLVMNDDLERAYAELKEIVEKEINRD
jgi:guanylate kinase